MIFFTDKLSFKKLNLIEVQVLPIYNNYMKKILKRTILILFISVFTALNVYSENMPNLKYKNIGNKDKISYDSQTGVWSDNIDKKSKNYFLKTKGFGDFYDYLDSNKNFAFTTNCEYEFIYNDSLIGYSNRDMKFYDILYANGGLSKRELSKEEVETIFPEYKVITFSDFSIKTNSIKLKKHSNILKIILLNDTSNTFDNYKFTSGNAKFEQYLLRGFLTVSKSGMIQFSDTNDENYLYFVILVR